MSDKKSLAVRQQWTVVWDAVERAETAIVAELDLLSELAAGACQGGRDPLTYQIECSSRNIREQLDRLQMQLSVFHSGEEAERHRVIHDQPVLVG
jgi:hypothetical protein